jgi:RNA polymerase sigma factor (TIGR02999 family)
MSNELPAIVLEKLEYDELFVKLVAELKTMVRRVRGRRTLNLSTTEIVDELYLKLRPTLGDRTIDRLHFLRTAVKAIRHYLADQARRRKASKRGSEYLLVTLKDAQSLPYPIEKQLDIDRALERLYLEDPVFAELIDLRYYGGCTDEELAKMFSISTATVQRRVRSGLAWLKLALQGKLDEDR